MKFILGLSFFVCLLCAVAMFYIVSHPAVIGAAATTRQLPIYCNSLHGFPLAFPNLNCAYVQLHSSVNSAIIPDE